MESESKLRIAVVGSGVAGITAAYLLQRKHTVTLYEKNSYIGGHTHTIVIDEGPDAGTPVDTGFIVFNDRTYPSFRTFLSQLNVIPAETDMSFSYYCRKTGFQYGSKDFNMIFAQRRNLLRLSFWHLLLEIVRFNRSTRRRLHEGRLQGITLGEYLDREGFGGDIRDEYLIPMAAAIWSTPDAEMLDFPAESFARFFENHGLLSTRRHPRWFFIPGGSHKYVTAFVKSFEGRIITGTAVTGVTREKESATVTLADGTERHFDRVVLATHADEAFELLSAPSPEESRLLSPWTYSRNRTVLHTDTSFLPPNRRAWASWNYIREKDAARESPVTVTYNMNRLQKLNTEKTYCVTLNPAHPVSPEHVVAEMEYRHPTFTFDALRTQNGLQELNNSGPVFFCGSYFGYGFHEDAVVSGLAVAGAFGTPL